ncbi:MAG TPA: PLP-dependent transferase [Actinomycetes bacterium]|jgi:cystathionine beta-lyase/cystathionine gamma-synthase|nr:PLP-dependent transferase [Actinomycetes bacterium]
MEVDATAWLAHAGAGTEPGAPAVPPIVAAAYFTSQGVPDAGSFHYARNRQPTWQPLEEALGGLEDAAATVFASGQAAALALLLALTEGRSRLLMPTDGYYNARQLARMLEPRGVAPAFVDLQDTGRVERALAEGPAVLWVESPTNPLLRVFAATPGAGGPLSRHGGPGAGAGGAADARGLRAAALLRAGRGRRRRRRRGGGVPDHPAGHQLRRGRVRRARWPSETASQRLIRVSVGLESPDDLIADIGQALRARH